MASFATIQDTLQYSCKFKELQYNRLGATKFTVCAAGFGSYRVHISVDEHRLALRQAIQKGINLIDTSSNYADGGAEELIGSVLKELQKSQQVKREEIVIVSKAGYLQGQNFEQSQQLKAAGNPYIDLVEYAQGLEHCIHPQFLEDQLAKSLKRLNMATIDVYLLHNPEYYLLWAHNNGLALADAQDEFYKRIEKAFMHLEIEVQNGRIQYYGISSNTFPADARMYGFVDLARIWNIARSISKDHKFRVIQLPYNLIEKGAKNEINQQTKQSVLDFAGDKSLAVLVNRPLNAFSNNQLNRLVSIEIQDELDDRQLTEKFEQIIHLEKDFIDQLLATLKLDEEKQKNLSGLFSIGSYLKNNFTKLGPYWSWIDNQAHYITEQISYAVQLVNEAPDKNNDVVSWLDTYVASFNDLLGLLTLYYGQQTMKHNTGIFEELKKEYPHFSDSSTLQQLALSVLFSTPAVSSTLVGMRRTEYVDDVLGTLRKR